MSRRSGVQSIAGALAVGAALALTLAAGCRRGTRGAAANDDGGPVQALLKQQRYDEAIAQVGGRSDPDALYLLGAAWAGKARIAPAGSEPTARWKSEERLALGFLERAVAARSDHAGAHREIAELLAPHALEHAAAHAPAAQPDEPDASVELVLRHFGEAIQADTTGTDAAEGLVRFATAAGRLSEADAAYQELVRRRREDATLLVRYGDFLAGPLHNPEGALAQYAQALIWHPDDASTRSKMAEIHLRAAAEHLKQHEYVGAEARLKEARKAGVEPSSAQAARLRELEQTLRDIRGR